MKLSLMGKKGFTLIEMLIVIAIIGILASIVLVGIGPVQRQARDARRVSDLRQVQNALELYFSKNTEYPDAGSWGELTTDLTTGANPIVKSLPQDPRSGQSYEYERDASGNGYILAAQLEDPNNGVLTGAPEGVSVNGLNCGEADAVYCVQF